MGDDLFNVQLYASRLGEYVNPEEEQAQLDRYREDIADSERVMLNDVLSGVDLDVAERRQREAADAAFRRWRLEHGKLLDVAEEKMMKDEVSGVKVPGPNPKTALSAA